MIRLLAAGLVFAGVAVSTLATQGTYAGASATAVSALRVSTTAGRALTGLMTAAFVVAAVAAIATTLLYRRFRLLASLAGGALLTGAVLIGITDLAGGERPQALAAVSQWPWLIGSSLASPLLGAAVAGVVTAAPWLSRSWRRTAWITLWLAGLAQLLTGISSSLEVILAFAAGITVGAGLLVLFGAPDRRIGPDEIAAALGSAGLPVSHVAPAAVETKGSRPFVAVADDGTQVFVKVLGSDNRDADLLYRAYRLLRLRDVGDTRPAASLIQAVEHQALVAVMAERAGVAVPSVRQVVKTADGSALRPRPGSGTGAHPARPTADSGCDRCCGGRILFPASRAGAGREQLAGHTVGRLGMAAANHRLVGGDVPGQRYRDHGRSAAAAAALADGTGARRLLVRQPRLSGQCRRHGPQRAIPAEMRR